MKSILVFLLLFSSSAFSQSVSVTPLYDNSSLAPGFLIPFKIGLQANQTVQSVSAQTVNGTDCRVMQDPFRSNIYLLKCLAADKVTLHFVISSDGKLNNVNYGQISVAYPGNFVPVKPPTGGGTDTQYENGEFLFASRCTSCHTPASRKPYADYNDIYNAIHTPSAFGGKAYPWMKDISLTTSQINDIVYYLEHL